MDVDLKSRVKRLEDFKRTVKAWAEKRYARYEAHDDSELRSKINQEVTAVQREVVEAGCFATLTIGPPPAIGGLVMRNVNPFDMIFDPPYGVSVIPTINDMIDQTIGALRNPPPEPKAPLRVDQDFDEGYAFVAMPIDPGKPELDDVLDAIKEARRDLSIVAERVDEAPSSERITDRVLESIRRAEFVIVDLTYSRPNVFYEAGYAHGLDKTPIYIARTGSEIAFDVKDYPMIFFDSMRSLREGLKARLQGLRGVV